MPSEKASAMPASTATRQFPVSRRIRTVARVTRNLDGYRELERLLPWLNACWSPTRRSN